MEKLITATACQNLDTRGDHSVQRLIPVLVAESINRIREYHYGISVPRVDLWNCIGMRMDKSYQMNDGSLSRREYSGILLDDKYDTLEKLGLFRFGRTIIRDDDEQVMSWTVKKIKFLLERDIVKLETNSVYVCENCGYTQALSGSRMDGCTVCNGHSFKTEDRLVLMVDIPDQRRLLASGKIVSPRKTRHIMGFFDQMPNRAMVSKVRGYGVDLGCIGLPECVLDPKIGVALMPEYVVENYNFSSITQVQGLTTVVNNLPYTSILSPGLTHEYVLLSKIPPITLEQVEKIGIGFFARYLPLFLTTSQSDLSQEQFDAVYARYIAIIGRIDNILRLLLINDNKVVGLTDEDRQTINEIFHDLLNYRVDSGLLKLWMFYKLMGRKYHEEMDKQGLSMKSDDAETLVGITRLFFR